MLYDFDDIVIIPEILSNVNSRKEINLFDENGMLPLFTAPMDTVVNENNWTEYNKNKIYSIIPRNLNKDILSINSYKWFSYGLDDFEKNFIKHKIFFTFKAQPETKFYALIDIANGHMNKLYEVAKKAKEIYGEQLVLMIGNIANPKTYEEYAKIGVDYVRLGIGNGAGCLTTQQTGIGYSMASLIDNTVQIKEEGNYKTKIVADGGFKKFADIIKALALGVDYVMLGSIFNKALESASENYFQRVFQEKYDIVSIDDEVTKEISAEELKLQYDDLLQYYFLENRLYKKYRGMSTKEVQESWGRTNLKTAEGISKYQKVEYTLQGWCQNFKDYLASAMSYTNSLDLNSFKNSTIEHITQNSFERFKK